MPKKLELLGMKFGRLTVISEKDKRTSRGKISWFCKCECGSFLDVVGTSLKSGHTKSCGCYLKDRTTKHGCSGKGIRSSYDNMKRRCYNKNHSSYPLYGGKGITVCQRWLESFENFLEDMLPTWREGLELDRKDSSKDYDPNNCRWVTKQQNTMNTGNTRNSSSRFKGVCLNKRVNKWVASIMKDGKRYYLGYFTDEVEAALVYNEKAKELFGEFAYINKIPEVAPAQPKIDVEFEEDESIPF